MKLYNNCRIKSINNTPTQKSLPLKSCNKSNNSAKISNTLDILALYNSVNFKGSLCNVSNIIQKVQDNNSSIGIIEEIKKLSPFEKEEFIKKFCSITGFPNIDAFNKRMVENSLEAANKASKKSGTPVIWSGYHKNCSLAKGLALVGSDLDGWAFIVKGGQSDKNRFKYEMWQNTNPLFSNIRGEFPYIFSIDEIYEWAKYIDELAVANGLDKNVNQYEKNLFETDDFEKAIKFNIDIRKALKKCDIEDLMQRFPSIKDEIRQRLFNNEPPDLIPVWITSSMGTCLEPLRSGKTLLDNTKKLSEEQKQKLRFIQNSFLYKYSNMSMQELKPGLKPKLKKRQVINAEWFNEMSVDEKTDFICKMLYESYPKHAKKEFKDDFGKKYEKMFANGSDLDNKRGGAIAKACS